MRLESKSDFKGFKLVKPFDILQKVVYLTGPNGIGKTRLFESMVSDLTGVEIDGVSVPRADIKYLKCEDLVPKVDGQYSSKETDEKRRLAARSYMASKGSWKNFELTKNFVTRKMPMGGGISSEELGNIIFSVARKLGKDVDDLTEEEVYAHYDGVGGGFFDTKNLAAIFGAFARAKEENEFNEWLSTVKGRFAPYVEEKDVEREFGVAPWVLLDGLLNEAFAGKFFLGEAGSYTGDAVTVSFFTKGSDTPIQLSDLSSGEKTLFWLALVLFMCGYERGNKRAPRLLLIDEPDAYLHPSMVMRLQNFLRMFSDQFDVHVIAITHSPTTVALAPEGSVIVLDDTGLSAVEHDLAISNLLVGVPHLSVSPRNRRQVYVESRYDVSIYSNLYVELSREPGLLDSKVSLEFVSSGRKFPAEELRGHIEREFGPIADIRFAAFLAGLNAAGCCSEVKGQVTSLVEAGNQTVRGLVDRDVGRNLNMPSESIAVLGGGRFRAIENLVFDPIWMVSQIHNLDSQNFNFFEICGKDVSHGQWLVEEGLLQKSVDWFLKQVGGWDNRRNEVVEYVDGTRIYTDTVYLEHDPHALHDKIVKRFGALYRLGKHQCIPFEVLRLSLIRLGVAKVPKEFVAVMKSLQE